MRRAVAVPRNSYCSPGNIPQMGDPIGFTCRRLGHFSRALVRVSPDALKQPQTGINDVKVEQGNKWTSFGRI